MKNTLIFIFNVFYLSQALSQVKDRNLIYERTRELFLQIYSPVVLEEAGLKLRIKLDEDSPDYFGGMSIKNQELIISLGAQAHRNRSVTRDSYLATLCHEVGHRLGGAPYKLQNHDSSPTSVEGQSDYYAATVCLKKIYSKDPETLQMNFSEIPASLQKPCAVQSSGDRLKRQVCLRTIKAGKEMAEQLYAIYLGFSNPPPRPDLLTAEEEGKSQNQLYPSLQCRLDTFVHGALNLSRPTCWFKP